MSMLCIARTAPAILAGVEIGACCGRRKVNLAIRWFCGYGLHEALADHSILTRIRQRWGAERFRRVFECTGQACLDAKNRQGRGGAHRRVVDPGRRQLGQLPPAPVPSSGSSRLAALRGAPAPPTPGPLPGATAGCVPEGSCHATDRR